VLAARGARNLDAGEEKIEDEASTAALRKNAGRIYLRSVTVAAIIVAAVFLISRAF
jgi:hypothetical protein